MLNEESSFISPPAVTWLTVYRRYWVQVGDCRAYGGAIFGDDLSIFEKWNKWCKTNQYFFHGRKFNLQLSQGLKSYWHFQNYHQNNPKTTNTPLNLGAHSQLTCLRFLDSIPAVNRQPGHRRGTDEAASLFGIIWNSMNFQLIYKFFTKKNIIILKYSK